MQDGPNQRVRILVPDLDMETMMKTPMPDPVGQHADHLQLQIDAAIANGDTDEIVTLSVHAIFVTAVRICREAGLQAPRLVGLSQLGCFLAFRDACDRHLEMAVDHRVSFAREAFEAIAMLEAELRTRSPTQAETKGDAARLLLLGKRLGHSDLMLGIVTAGIWKEYGEALRTLNDRGAHLRARVPTWEVAFMPAAASFCEGKEKVTLGGLVAEARRWAAAEIAAGRNPGLPGTDDGIKQGLKRMEKRGLSIPGR